MSQMLFRLTLFTTLFALSACFGGGHYAPVVERQERAKVIPSTHVVARGETLYSIAWRYNKDVRGLASTNGVRAPYTIYPGQHLKIKSVSKKLNSKTKTTTASTRTNSSSAPNSATQSRQQTPAISSSSGSVVWSKKRYPFRWKWPARGRVTTQYSSASAVHKGIDIQGKLGEPVHAANSGKVVYAGSGLVGYGKLLIVKHDEHYLSAYGHNRRLLVKEGEMVRVGQKIAEFGDTGTDKVKLHFEIRRDGKPVNPLRILPRG